MTQMVYLHNGYCVDKDCVRVIRSEGECKIIVVVQLSATETDVIDLEFESQDEAEKAFSRIFDDLR